MPLVLYSPHFKASEQTRWLASGLFDNLFFLPPVGIPSPGHYILFLLYATKVRTRLLLKHGARGLKVCRYSNTAVSTYFLDEPRTRALN